MAGSVAKLKNGKYQARWRDQSRKQRSKNFVRKVDAVRFLDTVRGDLVRGTYIDVSVSKTTLRDYAEHWRTNQPHRARTQHLYERTLRRHIYPVLGDRQMRSITRSDIQGLVHELSKHLAPKTVRTAYGLVRTVLGHAVDDRLLTHNPCRRVALPEEPPRNMRLFAPGELWALADRMPTRYRALIMLAFTSGMRQGEILGLRRGDVDFAGGAVHVRKQLVWVPGAPPFMGEPKTRSSIRTIPLPSFTMEALRDHLNTYETRHVWDLVFTDTRDHPVGRASFHKTFRAAMERSGIDRSLTFHCLRHTYASILIAEGCNVVNVASRLGHATPSETLRTYSHLFPAADDETRTAVAGGLGPHHAPEVTVCIQPGGLGADGPDSVVSAFRSIGSAALTGDDLVTRGEL